MDIYPSDIKLNGSEWSFDLESVILERIGVMETKLSILCDMDKVFFELTIPDYIMENLLAKYSYWLDMYDLLLDWEE